MRKLVIARFKLSDFKTIGSQIERELGCLVYSGKGGRDHNGYYLVGQKTIKYFVARMKAIINGAKVLFPDEQSAKEFAADVAFLDSLLKTKAIAD
jgi:hypothetical protein